MPLYVFNVTHIRSLVWMVSLGCLICMAVMLVGAAQRVVSAARQQHAERCDNATLGSNIALLA